MSTRSKVAGGGSASAVYAETVTGWHVLKVEGYSLFKGIGVSQRVKSGRFTVGGHRWSITFFPDGLGAETEDWICVDIYLEDQIHTNAVVKVRACLTLSMLDQTGEPVPAYTRSSKIMFTISSTDSSRGCGFIQFIQREDMESSFLKDDSFQVRCDVTVVRDIRTRVIKMESPMVPPELPPPDLQRHLGDLLSSKVGWDVTFKVNGDLFTEHRCVLAVRSSVFMAELFGPMKEMQTQHVVIQDMEARVFKIMLQLIYTDSLPEIEADERTVIAQHLLVAADQYNLQRLKMVSEELLCSSVDISTVATTLVLAEQHACQGLKAACFEFLSHDGNLKEVMASEGFEHLKRCPSFLQELLAMFAP